MLLIQGVRQHFFHFSEKPHLVGKSHSSIDCSTLLDNVMQLSLKELQLAELPTNQQVVLNLPLVFCSRFTLIAVQENLDELEMSQAECRETLHKLLPNVPLPDEQVCLLTFFKCFLLIGCFFLMSS